MRVRASRSITYSDGAIVLAGMLGLCQGAASSGAHGQVGVRWDTIISTSGFVPVRDTDASAVEVVG